MSDPVKGSQAAGDRPTSSPAPQRAGASLSSADTGRPALGSSADDIAQRAKGLKDAATDAASKAGRSAAEHLQDAKDQAAPAIATFKDQASQAAQEAKSTVSALAEEARSRLNEMVDQQKNAGADRVAGVARAAQAAAGNLEESSPQLARLVKSAADSVDHVAADLRGSDLGDIFASLSHFGRRQPVAFFGAAVVAGFFLARFLKSDAQPSGGAPRRTGLPRV